jgi:hypothetical protein
MTAVVAGPDGSHQTAGLRDGSSASSIFPDEAGHREWLKQTTVSIMITISRAMISFVLSSGRW